MNLSSLKNKHTVKVPKNTSLLYCDKKKLLTFVGLLQKKSLQLQVKVFFIRSTNSVLITDLPTHKTSNANFKNLKSVQGTTLAKIKQILLEVAFTLHQKLELVGVGYRVFSVENFKNQLCFKLGYSHLIYFKIETPMRCVSTKFTEMFLFGKVSFEKTTQIAAMIRGCKRPEPYKGKGILYQGERIALKKGKKI